MYQHWSNEGRIIPSASTFEHQVAVRSYHHIKSTQAKGGINS